MSIRDELIKGNSLTSEGKVFASKMKTLNEYSTKYSLRSLIDDSANGKYYSIHYSELKKRFLRYKSFSDLLSTYDNLRKENKNDAKSEYLLVYALIYRIDELLGEDDRISSLTYLTYDSSDSDRNGLVILGRKIWLDSDYIYDYDTIKNIRFIMLDSKEEFSFNKSLEYTRYIKIFSNKEAQIFLSHSNSKYTIQTKIVAESSYDSNAYLFDAVPNRPYYDNRIKEYIVKDNKKIHCTESTYDAIQDVIWHCPDKASLIVFPELIIDEWELEAVKELLGRISRNQNYKFVIIGVHKPQGDDSYKNCAIVLYKQGSKWVEISEYTKSIQASYTLMIKNDITENVRCVVKERTDRKYSAIENLSIDDANPGITLLPFNDCIVGIAICRDTINILDPNCPLNKYKDIIDIMVVLSYNKSETKLFYSDGELFARYCNCAFVYSNNIVCNKNNKETETSFVFAPYKGKKAGTNSFSGVICSKNINSHKETEYPVIYKKIDDTITFMVYTLKVNETVEATHKKLINK